jgi:hypothetical protein
LLGQQGEEVCVLLLKIEETAPLVERKRQKEGGSLEVKVELDAEYIADIDKTETMQYEGVGVRLIWQWGC